MPGVLEQIAPPPELYDRPGSAFVAEFVGLTNPLAGVVTDGTIELLGVRVAVLPGSVAAGPARALVRPELVELNPDETGAGRVVTASFLGSMCRVHVDLESGESLVAQVPSGDAERLGPGARVAVSLKPLPVFAKPA